MPRKVLHVKLDPDLNMQESIVSDFLVYINAYRTFLPGNKTVFGVQNVQFLLAGEQNGL